MAGFTTVSHSRRRLSGFRPQEGCRVGQSPSRAAISGLAIQASSQCETGRTINRTSRSAVLMTRCAFIMLHAITCQHMPTHSCARRVGGLLVRILFLLLSGLLAPPCPSQPNVLSRKRSFLRGSAMLVPFPSHSMLDQAEPYKNIIHGDPWMMGVSSVRPQHCHQPVGSSRSGSEEADGQSSSPSSPGTCEMHNTCDPSRISRRYLLVMSSPRLILSTGLLLVYQHLADCAVPLPGV